MTNYIKEQLAHKETGELYHTVHKYAKGHKKALEVGIAWSITTIAILEAGVDSLVSVDKGYYQNTINQVNEYGYTNWTFLQEPSQSLLPKLADKFDFICIDGSHYYEDIKADLINAKKLLSDDGIIVIDDYNHKYNFNGDYGVKRAVDEFVKKENLKIKVENMANGIAIIWGEK